MFPVKRLVGAALVGLAGLALVSPVSASEVSVQDHNCVRTTVSRNSQGRVEYITVMNICQATLLSVDAHVYNGPAGFEDRNRTRRNLAQYQFFRFPSTGSYSPAKAMPSKSLLCGELWAPAGAGAGRPWGPDCYKMP
ncbi:hypothetical protein [Kibdelosporangium phytohabitans]|uniref:Secreted protein n=1 Tax=Kibdelosporangium phytohabitans TaxID=860235 RepID=A0A0N9HZN2_9PSEU|nr:hypothetical protein [Kibdelosporangium phytohabitans]ALG08857.1 hypothetical protein AOZ06_19805 [Kibdelosporangium phytohabitans]MBE1469993.1 hypothetical protein [Kibdelosporangium phytohabitans]